MEPKNNEVLDVVPANKSLKMITHIVYLCQTIALFFVVTSIVGVVLNYFKLSEARGTWFESHFRWQLRTFWFGALYAIIGVLLFLLGGTVSQDVSIVGVVILAINALWIIYRIIRGWVMLGRDRAVKA